MAFRNSERVLMDRISSSRLFILIAAFILCRSITASDDSINYADLVVINANVISVDKNNPRSEAFAVKDGKFIAVGSTEEIKTYIGRNTKNIDLEGKTVTPGFFDSHLHPQEVYPETSPYHILDVRPEKAVTIEEMIALMKKRAAYVPIGQWVVGARYEDSKYGRHPTKEDLDKISTEHPVLLVHSSGHVGVVNSLAFKLASISGRSKNPPGGEFEKNNKGELTGVCKETAWKMVVAKGPKRAKPSSEKQVEALNKGFRYFLSNGITSIVDAKTSIINLGLYQKAIKGGQKIRIGMFIDLPHFHTLKKNSTTLSVEKERLKISGIKIFHGNSLSAKTCWLYEPYDMLNAETGKRDYHGIPPARSQEDLDALILDIHKEGFQIAVHSNGDKEIDMVLSAFEKAQKAHPRKDPRFRIEHGSVVNQRILDKMKRLNVVYAAHSYIYEHGDKMEGYGEKRWDWMHANASAHEMGIVICGNSDFTVSDAQPLLRIQSMVTRKSAEGKVYGVKQKVSPEVAIWAWTMGSAYANYEEKIKGSIEVGKLADFVILDNDPTKVPHDTIKDIQIEQTFIDGEVVYAKNKASAVPY